MRQTYVTPGATAISTISWRYYLVFICLTFLSIIVIYFFYPETKGRSLEELAAVFGDPVAVKLEDITEGQEKEVDVRDKNEIEVGEHEGDRSV